MPTNSILSPSPIPAARSTRVPDTAVALILAIFVGILFATLNPLANVPMNDDFSWARSAKAFADTGKIVYNGWGNPILLPHIIIGGLLVKLFGFSHIILSGFGIISGMAFTASVYLLARACGVRRSLSLFATALTVLNPIFLGCAPSFMSDVPSACLYTVALLAFVKALHRPSTDDSALQLRPVPLGVAVVCAFLAGANRQVLWASLLLSFAAAFFYLAPAERFKKLIPSLAVIFVGAAGLSAWFAAQPYSVTISVDGAKFLWDQARELVFWYPYKFFALTGFALLPVTLPLVVQAWKTRARPAALLLGSITVGIIPLLIFLVQPNTGRELWNGYWGLTTYGQYATSQGVMVGGPSGYPIRPMMIPPIVGTLLYFLGAVGIGTLIWTIVSSVKKRPVAASVLLIGSISQLILPIPWFANGSVSDRYLFTLTPGLLIGLLASFPQSPAASAGAEKRRTFNPYLLGAPFAAAFAITGYLFAQEYFAATHAREMLYRALVDDKKIPPQLVDGGVETSGDTQIALGKYINNVNIKNPPDAYIAGANGNCVFGPNYFPVMDAHYVLSLVYPAPDLSDAQTRDFLILETAPVARADYYSILAPHKRTIYVYRLAKP